MVRYQNEPSNSSSDVLFDASEDIELLDVTRQYSNRSESAAVDNKPNNNEQEQSLLESFQTDTSDETDIEIFDGDGDDEDGDGDDGDSEQDKNRDMRLQSTTPGTSVTDSGINDSAALQDRINRSLMSSAGASSSATLGDNPLDVDPLAYDHTIQNTSTAARIKNLLSYQSLRNNFNFLERVYRPLPANRHHEVGEGSDGVFSNLAAKPDLASAPVESDKPPTYDEVSQDQTPPYWENSIVAPGFMDEVFIDGLPVGNIINFIWNLLVSTSFQLVGFLLTYLLHTSHAAKQGSRAGLGFTFISYGWSMIPKSTASGNTKESLDDYKIEPEQPGQYENFSYNSGKVQGTLDKFTSTLSTAVSQSTTDEEKSPHLKAIGVCVIAMGVFIVIKALMNYHRAKKMEDVILQPPQNVPEEQV